MPLDSTSDVSDIERVSNADGDDVPVANDGTYATLVTGADIDATGVLATFDTHGKRVLDLALDGTAGADYALDASPDGVTWFEGFDTWTGVSTIRAVYNVGFRHVRLRVTGAAAAGETADLGLGVS